MVRAGWRLTLTRSPTEAVMTPNPATPPAAATPPRLDSVDLLRGAVMVVMALDHVRDFFCAVPGNPQDPSQASPALFLTRWVTHFCAPVFVFLAGAGASLAAARGQPRRELAWFLFTRGLWLVVLELTLIRLGWSFDVTYRLVLFQVIWAIGWSMVALAALAWAPVWAVGLLGIAIVAGHNLLDEVPAGRLGPAAWVLDLLHTPRPFEPAPGYTALNLYPLLPWFGVMAAGYGFGPLLLTQPAGRRRRLLIGLGLALTLAFVALRAAGLYGDPRPWSPQGSTLTTVLAFVNCTKYPPSLLFVLMTLGPAVLALGLFDRPAGPAGRVLVTYGRVPLFYYLIHFPLIHALAVGLALFQCGEAGWLFADPLGGPRGCFGLGLPGTYLVWVGVVALLYLPCRWYAGVKRRRGGVLRYL
jgi:uncharacterized membrane protein